LTLRILVAYQGNLGTFMGMKVPDDIWSPVAVTDYADANHGAPLASSQKDFGMMSYLNSDSGGCDG
jgi:hypothetical protein